MSDVMPGAEPWSVDGGPVGVLVLHGFTGNPSSVRELAEAFAGAGHSVEMPLLPGHGTRIEDMLDMRWEDWSAEAEAALERLAARTGTQFVAGLSMGGGLASWLGTRHPELAGLICVNPMAGDYSEMADTIAQFVAAGEVTIPGIGSDIAAEGVEETAYDGTPLAPLVSAMRACSELSSELGGISQPVLIFTSPEDHVVPPEASDFLAEAVSGPVERVSCDRSYHVATQDNDKQMIFDRSVDFVARISAGS